jgi:hypothetical protein
MNQRIASALAFASSAAAAALAAVAMTGTAQAESPTIDTTKFVSDRSRMEVRDETRAAKLSAAGGEWSGQKSSFQPSSSLTRAQVRAEYIGAREEVLARNSEGGQTSFMAAAPVRTMPVMIAEQPAR